MPARRTAPGTRSTSGATGIPIERFGRESIAAGLLSEDEIAQIRKEVADEISAAIREAAAAPEPDRDAIAANVYGDRETAEQFRRMDVAGPFGEREGTRTWRT